MHGRFFAIVASLTLTACSSAQDISSSEAAIANFHRTLNTGRFGSLYTDAAADMKRATTAEVFAKLLTAVHRKLGTFKSGTSSGWNTNYTTGGTFVTIVYNSKYEKGTAQENFVYRIVDAQPALVGYHINSDALILN